MAGPFRLAHVGAGGVFAASVAHGLAAAMASGPEGPEPVEVAVVDAAAERAERMAAYLRVVARARDLPLSAVVLPLDAALTGAGVVVRSADEPRRVDRLARLYQRVGWTPPEEGQGAVARAVAAGASYLGLARAVAERCPTAPLIGTIRPADVLAGAVRRRHGIAGVRAAGISADVPALRSVLAFMFREPEDDVLLIHGGVDRVGWVLRFAVGGRDGYGELGDRLHALGRDPAIHPANRVISEVYGLTGLIRASADHAWPFALPPEEAPPEARFPDRQRLPAQALAAALRAGRPISEPEGAHPKRSPLRDPGLGRALGRLVLAMAGGPSAVVPLQMPYGGEVLGWSPELTVEVPALVAGGEITPMAVGPLPGGVDGLPRLLAQQRALASDYLCAPDASVLRRALAVTPNWGRVDQIHALAEVLHAEFGPELQAAAA